MALKALMLKSKLTKANKDLEALRAKSTDFEKREGELEKAIEEAETDEERTAVEESVKEFEAEKATHKEELKKAEETAGQLAKELEEVEKAEEKAPPAEQEDRSGEAGRIPERRSMDMNDVIKKRFAEMTHVERAAVFSREDVKGWLAEIRSCISEKRALTNIGLTIPEVFLGLLRENITVYSKLYRHVAVKPLSGTGRENIMGTVPEGIWTECCAILNELSLGFNDAEVDCFKVGGYFKVCNAILEDSDINLASELISAIGQAIGFALDKAILYGRNTSAHSKMPLGIVSRLAQTEAPADYPATARTWVDLHATHMLSIPNNVTGLDLFKILLIDSGVISNKYSRGNKIWVMNEITYTYLKAQAMSINAAGAIVSGVEGTMPVIGGTVEVLDFIPNYVIIGGYMDLYLLAERAGQRFAQSEHAFFIQDQTAFKGTARYDGLPVIAEAFVAIGLNGVQPTADMEFAPDNANIAQYILVDKSSISMAVSANALQINAKALNADGLVMDKAEITWATSDESKVTVSDKGKITPVAAGSAVITASSGSASAIVNVTVTA